MPSSAARKHQEERPGPAVRYFDGNLLVQQVRSSIGRNIAQLDALRSLKLWGIGRSATCDTRQASVVEQLATVDFLVAVTPLSLDAATFGAASQQFDPTADLHEFDGLKEDSGKRGFTAGRDGFAQYEEQADGMVAIIWSTALPAATTLRRVSRLKGWKPGAGESVIVDHRKPRRLDSKQGVDKLRRPSDAQFARVDLGVATIAWASPTYPRHVDDGFAPGRLGMRCPGPRLASVDLKTLIASTATPEIGQHASTLAATFLSAG